MLTPEQIKACMEYLPFQDRDDEIRLVSDKIVLARKDATCMICFQPAYAGTHHRVETAVVDGEIQSARYCETCCAAMAVAFDDDEPILARFRVGHGAEASA